MCGIAGIFNVDADALIDKDILGRMSDVQEHRGPDESGVFIDHGIGLAHRRLSIIDLASGQQPLTNEDGSVIVTYNGEIYNYPELMAELIKYGHQFKTHSDTEVIVHAWEEWGKDCVNHFRGMFAFAIWDKNKESLFIARDRLGIKPLYYSLIDHRTIIFGSELKVLTKFPGVTCELNHESIQDYFSLGYIPDPKSIYKNINKLKPGENLYICRSDFNCNIAEYWDIPFSQTDYKNEDDIVDEFNARLKEATKIRMVSEVPIGAFLSGGVDSSAIVALMSELTDNKVTTCNISFNNKEFDESEYAAQVAKLFDTNHIVEKVDSDQYSLIDKLINIYDEPFADSSALPTYKVCEMAGKHMTVVLSGDGGDETFAGYRRHAMHMHEERLRSVMPLGLRKLIFGPLAKVYPKADWAPQVFRAKTTFQSLALNSASAYFNSVSIMNDDVRGKLFSDKFRKSLGGYRSVELFNSLALKCPSDHPLSQIQYLDYKTYLPGDILTKVDRASMAHSIEVRVPILDHQFIEWASSIRPDYKLRGNKGKYIFKKAMERYLPDDILYRKKMGFSVPVGKWFKRELRNEILALKNSPPLSDSGIFDMGFISTMVDSHLSGKRDFTVSLWSLLVFDKFLCAYQDS